MTLRTILLFSAGLLATPIAAQDATGDAAAGEEHFNRQCTACHVVANEAGEVLAGRRANTGPNLFGVVGRAPGSVEDYDYSELMEAYGATEGVVWEEANFVGYIMDPTGFLREATGQDSGRSKMAYQVRDEQEAHDLYAYLATFTTEEAAAGEAAQDAGAEGAGEDGAAVTAQVDASEQAPEGEAAEGDAAGTLVADLSLGEGIYQEVCRNCHGPTARGMASFPKLTGYDADYLLGRLHQYHAGERVGPNSALMIPVAQELSEQEMADVAAYIAETFE